MKVEVKNLVEAFEPRTDRSFSDQEIAKALDGVEFPVYIQVVGSYSNYFGWKKWALIEPNGDRYEQRYHGSAVEGFWASSHEDAYSELSSYEDKLYIEHPEDRVIGEWVIDDEVTVQYEYWTNSFGEWDETTKVSFPPRWGSRKKADKIRWLMGQDEVRSAPYLLRALEVWSY